MSADFIYEQEKNDKKIEAALRQKVNVWAKSIPHHPYTKLGDELEVLSIWYKPAYPLRLLSQYEERKKDKGYRPYKNDSIPERTLFKLNDFNSWDIDLGEVKNFENSSNNYIVSGSQYIEDCHKCNALGWIQCVTCGGAGKRKCTTCRGVGESKCHSCGGNRTVRCSSCNGRGSTTRTVTRSRQVWIPERYDSNGNRIGNTGMYQTESYNATETQTCSYCNGSGKRTCSTCSGSGKITCSTCGGSGIIICSSCRGSGRNVCPVCEGQKKLLHYFYVNRKLSYTKQATCIIHSEVFDKFPELLENYNTYHSYNVFSNYEEKLEKEQLAKGNHLNKFLNAYIEKSHKENTDTHCMIFQQAEVDCIDVLELTYRFNKKEYVMLFQGNKREVIPGISPVYEVAFTYLGDGIKAARTYRYDKAYKLLTKAAQIDTYEIKNDVNYALKAIKEKFEKSFDFGNLLGFIFSMFLGGFMSYYYFKNVNYVFDYAGFINKTTNFLYTYHAWALTFTYLFLCFGAWKLIKKYLVKYAVKIPGGVLVRIIAGVLTNMIVSLLALILLALLNVTGITIVISFVLWVIVWIIKIILIIIVLIYKVVVWLFKAVWKILKWFWHLFF